MPHKIVLYRVAVGFVLSLFTCFTIGMHPTPGLPTPWYLNTTSSVNLPAGSTIIDTCRLNYSEYFAITGINGSNSVGFYRYKLGNNEWVGVSTTLSAVGWAYDKQRNWSNAIVAVNPWTTTPYIIYVYSNNLVFQQYPLPDTVFDGSSNTAVGTAHIVNLPRVVPNPHLVLHWADNSTLVLGIHPYTAPKAGIQAYFIIGRFQVNATGIVQETIHNRNQLVYSIEFECSLCSVDNARLTFANGTMRYLMRSGATYSWNSALSPIMTDMWNPELSHKCYNYQYNITSLLFRIPPSQGAEVTSLQKIIDSSSLKEFDYIMGPDGSSSFSPYQVDTYCHADLTYTASITTSNLMQQQVEWKGTMNLHAKGKAETIIYAISAIGDFLETQVLVVSTPGNDNISQIYVDDSQFHLIGYTEGNIADPTVTLFSDKLIFAGFTRFDIASIKSPEAVDNPYPFEILPGRDFAITFSSLPENRTALSVPVVTLNLAPLDNVRWIGDDLYALAPSVVGLNWNLGVEFRSYPHIPRCFKKVSPKRPSVLNMTPSITDIAPFTMVRFTVLYMGLAELNATTILIGNQKCEIQKDGLVPNYFETTTFICSVPFESIGTKFVNFTSSNQFIANNFTLTYRQVPQNISITIDEGQETPIILNCSAYATIFNDIEYRLLETPTSSYGRLYFENKTDFPSGSNVDVGDTLGRLRFRSTSHGRVNFQYYCPERNLTFTPLLGSVVINIRPIVRCQNTVVTTGTFSLDDRSTVISNLTFTFLLVPTWGNLGSVVGGEIYELGSSTAETNIRLYGRLSINQSHVGSFAYVATNKYGMTSDRCEVGFVISCRPLFMNVFNYSSSDFCTTCPMGATCSTNGEHLPFAAKGFWTRTGEYSPDAKYLPCLPASACPGLPSGECAAGFRGFRCAECAAKYYKFANDCLPCKTGHEMNTILAFVVLIGGGALAYGLSKLVKAGPTFGLVSILISFLQTIVILRGFQLNWPPEFYEVLGWLSAINFNIEFTAPECFVGDFISYSQKLRVTLVLPIFFIAVAFFVSKLTVAVQWIRYKLPKAKKHISTHDQKKDEIFKSINAILVFLYTSVATSALGHFDCLLDIDGNYYLDRDASLKCYDDAWNADLPFVVSAICIYVVGIPIYFSLMFYFMYQKRRNSRIWSNARIIAFRIMKFDEFYHPGRQYFVLINLLQKLALVAAGVYFTDQRGIQTVLTSLCLNATLVLSIVYKPYSLGILNTAEQLSFAASIAVLGFGLPFLTDSIGSSVKSFLTFTILSVIFGFILFIVVACLIEAKARASSSRIASLFRKKADAPETPYKQSLLVEESKLRV